MSTFKASDNELCDPQCKEVVELLRRIIIGNGDPEHGVLMRLAWIEKQLTLLRRLTVASLGGIAWLIGHLVLNWFEHVFNAR